MLKVKRVMMIRDLCKMFNFVQVRSRKDISLKINLGDPLKLTIVCGVISKKRLMKNVCTLTPQAKTNKRQAQATSERAEGII